MNTEQYPELRDTPESVGATFAALVWGNRVSVPHLIGTSIAAGAIADFCETGVFTLPALTDACNKIESDLTTYKKYLDPRHIVHVVSDAVSAIRVGRAPDDANWMSFFRSIEQETLAMTSTGRF